MTAPALPEPSSLEWAIATARRLAGDRLPPAPAGGEGAAEVPGSLAAPPVWGDEEWSAELALTASLRGPVPGVWHYNPYTAAAAFLRSPDVALKRRQEGQLTEEYADPLALAASLDARAAAFAASWPALTADLEPVPVDAPASLWDDLSIIKRGW